MTVLVFWIIGKVLGFIQTDPLIEVGVPYGMLAVIVKFAYDKLVRIDSNISDINQRQALKVNSKSI